MKLASEQGETTHDQQDARSGNARQSKEGAAGHQSEANDDPSGAEGMTKHARGRILYEDGAKAPPWH